MLLRGYREAARVLSLGERSIWSLVACNALPHHRVGRAVMFDPAELRAWIASGCLTAPGSADRVRAAMRKGGAR